MCIHLMTWALYWLSVFCLGDALHRRAFATHYPAQMVLAPARGVPTLVLHASLFTWTASSSCIFSGANVWHGTVLTSQRPYSHLRCIIQSWLMFKRQLPFAHCPGSCSGFSASNGCSDTRSIDSRTEPFHRKLIVILQSRCK